MKNKFRFLIAAFVISLGLHAQEDMQTVWEKKFDHQGVKVGTGLEGPNEVSYIADDKEITVFKTADGSIVWNAKFKELVPRLRKCDAFAPFWASDAIFVFDYKTGKDQLAVIDLNTGKVLWESVKYQGLSESNITYIPEQDAFILSLSESLVYVKARTGEEIWETSTIKGSIAQYEFIDGDMVMFNMSPGGLVGFLKDLKIN